MILNKKVAGLSQSSILLRFFSRQRFVNYGESSQRGHVAGICLQLLAFFELFARHIFGCGDAYRALI